MLTDYFGVYGYMDSDQAIRGGTDCMLVAYDTETNHHRHHQRHLRAGYASGL